MEVGSLLFSAGAGFIAFFAPCSLPLIPAYVGYALGEKPAARERWQLMGYALVAGAGLLFVFGLFGALFALIGSFMITLIPLVETVAGFILLFLGMAALSGYAFALRMPHVPLIGRGPVGRFFSFGAAYAVGALGCSLPIFLMVISQAFIIQGIVEAATQFLVYGVTMAFLMMAVFALTAVSQKFIARRLLPHLPLVQKLGGLLVAVAGIFMISRGFRILL